MARVATSHKSHYEKLEDLPAGWAVTRIGDVCKIFNGNSINNGYKIKNYTGLKNGYNFIATKDVGFNADIAYENGVKIPFDISKGFKIAHKGSSLLCIEGGSAGRKIGLLTQDVCFGNKLCAFESDIINDKFVYYFLQTPRFLSLFHENKNGLIGGVSINKLKDLPFFVPPEKEQVRIVLQIKNSFQVIDTIDREQNGLASIAALTKSKILDLAMRGKLVPQDPMDEPASELLARVTTSHKSNYEKLANPPYKLPTSWAWVCLENVCWLDNGNAHTGEKLPYLEALYLRGKKEAIIQESGILLQNGDKVILVDGENSGEVFDINERGYMGSTFRILKHSQAINIGFLQFFLALQKKKLHENKTGSAIPHLNKKLFASLPCALPPLNEQIRIVARIEELLPFIEEYDKKERALTSLNIDFPSALKKSIIQSAVQGKLVEQDSADEPASDLIERIREERQKLIKAGKIKRDKSAESVIFRRDNSHYEKLGKIERCIDYEMPFNLPESWAWTRLGMLIQLTSGQDMTSDKYNENGNGVPYLTGASNIENGDVIINRWTPLPKSIATEGDLLITCKGTVGTMAYLKYPQAHIARQIMSIKPTKSLCKDYIRFFLETYVFWLKAAARSMIPGIAREDILQILFPVPPLAEQHRIVRQVDSLLKICRRLI
ncbi:MAG: restriction endonuclease subunit S [Christensenellaceae bacterium]|nr:restriction endonuclease subunit S [Christensenellaceae bacterium]